VFYYDVSAPLFCKGYRDLMDVQISCPFAYIASTK
jgi:hypothetical protein